MKDKKNNSGQKTNYLHLLAQSAIIAGAIGSLGFTLKAGHKNSSILLVALFIIWVLLPFVVLSFVSKMSRAWKEPERVMLDMFILSIGMVSLISYSGIFIPSDTKPAFIFLMVPLISLILTILVLIVIKLKMRNMN